MSEGLEDDPEASGWTKTRLFGHVVYARRVHGAEPVGRLLLAMRIGNIPLGVPFRAHGAWGVIDVIPET